MNPSGQITFGSWLIASFLFYGKAHIPLIHTYEKAVVEAGGVEGGSIALMAIDVKAVAGELGIPMLL